MKSNSILIGLAAFAAFGCGGGTNHAPSMPAAVTSRVVQAAVVGVPQTVELYGTVQAERVAAVSSRVMATVRAVHVRAGDAVSAGQLLAEIDPQTTQGQEAQARGGLAQARAALVVAERNYGRYRALAAKEAASALELDMATMQLDLARGAVEQAQGAVDAAASIAKESRVVAPFAGRIVAKLVEVGDLAAPGRAIVMLESNAGRSLVVAVPESLVVVAGVKPGSRLSVRIDAFPGLGEIAGVVSEMAPGAEPGSHTFTVKVGLGDTVVPSGVSGRARLSLGSRTAVVVAKDAIINQGGLTMIIVRDVEGRARSRAVTVGSPLADGTIEVLSGLRGDEAVLAGLTVLPADGAPVTDGRS